MQQTSSSEFLRFVDLAPYIDKYGLKKYKLDFDIKSDDISKRNTATVYFQNGSNAKYAMSNTVPVTTSFVHQSITFTPTLSNGSLTESYLAFYGTYNTGNILTVKDVSLQLAG